jgi:sulfur relay (sulfurtransferase) DsrF/TusC family protein
MRDKVSAVPSDDLHQQQLGIGAGALRVRTGSEPDLALLKPFFKEHSLASCYDNESTFIASPP